MYNKIVCNYYENGETDKKNRSIYGNNVFLIPFHISALLKNTSNFKGIL
jgi:hypothetical protein